MTVPPTLAKTPFSRPNSSRRLNETKKQQPGNRDERDEDTEISHPLIFTDELQQLRISTSMSIECLKSDLSVERLNIIHQHLWWAGKTQAARPLHRQRLLGRQIMITEQADIHLLWVGNRIFIKPLPAYLLSPKIWDEHVCKDLELYAAARGLLLSYLWLIRHKSDLDIAKDHRLLPEAVDWDSWVNIVENIQDSFDLSNPQDVSKRYDFGELRINRMHHITRLKALRSLDVYGCINGYTKTYTNYGSFFDTNFHWIIIVFAFGSILLSAFQVGLSTERLQDEVWFQNMSLGFSMLFIAFLLFLVAFLVALFLALFFYFLLHTLKLNKRRVGKEERKRGTGQQV